MKKRKKEPPYCANLEVDQWHERDRNNVNVKTKGGREVASWWDEDVHGMVDDGFFKTQGPFARGGISPRSVIDYLESMGMCRPGNPGSIFDGARRRRR